LLFSATAALLLTSAALPVTEVFPVPASLGPAYSVHVPMLDGGPDILEGIASPNAARAAVAAGALSAVTEVDAGRAAQPESIVSLLTYDAPRRAAATDPAVIARMKGPTLLRSVGMLSSRELTAFVADHPDTVRELIRTPPATAQVTRWWNHLPPAQRTALAAGAPQIVGNLEGLPVTVRDAANRRYLAESKRAILDRLDRGVGRGVQRTLLRDLRMLEKVETALGERDAMPERSLLTLDTRYPGRAAIALGDLATADYVTFLVPGMFYSVDAHIRDWTDAAARIYDAQAGFVGLFHEHRTVATVAWIGYQTPHTLNIGTLDLAREGADYLSNAVDGVRSLQLDDPFVSVIAHSYGTTATLLALSDGSTSVDSVALVGSPGSGAQNVRELNVPAENVYVGEASMDPIVDTAFFGSDPGAASFGARKMSVAGSVDRLTSEVLNPSRGHNDYFTPGSEAMRNMALVGIDKGRWVTDGSADDAGKTLALAR
jgi:pimeloyl-ACP methyl ester carboxylesterase